jgi:hypothetical protein
MEHAAHLFKEVQLYECGSGKEKRRRRGKSSAAPRSEHRGRVVRSSVEKPLSEDYLEILMAWIAESWARASRASMGANITLSPRRRFTIIPATAGRVLATPWAWGRISVTVDLVITT